MDVSEELREELEEERRWRREAETLLAKRRIDLTRAQAELEVLRGEVPQDETAVLLAGVLASLHGPLRNLLLSLVELFELLPPESQSPRLKGKIRQEVGQLVEVLHSIEAQQGVAGAMAKS